MKKQMDREEIEKRIEDSHGESNKEETMKWLEKEYEEFVRLSGPSFDWVEALLTVLITVISVGGFSVSIANVIMMLVEHKFAYWKAAIDIFWATVFLGQWAHHLAMTIMWKLK